MQHVYTSYLLYDVFTFFLDETSDTSSSQSSITTRSMDKDSSGSFDTGTFI